MGTAAPDDAGVYRISDDLALVLTLDFFTPVVDDPHTFGEIAAANALSDVYAMGGEPFAAMNIVAFPAASEELPLSVLGDILEGGSAKAAEAGTVVIGGHTVDDPEPKYGLAVVGRVHPEKIARKEGARPGDRLILTKPLGTGIITTALKQERIDEAGAGEAIRVMAALNREAGRALTETGIVCATDVTGYGLLGHLTEVLEASGCGARVSVGSVPVLDGARDLAADGVAPGGTRKTLRTLSGCVAFSDSVEEADQLVLADAQTSGGLLLVAPPGTTDDLLARLEAASTPAAAVIGEITEGDGILVEE